MFLKNLKNYKIILASLSPRRQYLLNGLGIDFIVETTREIEEVYPDTFTKEQIPVFLAELKANKFNYEINDNIIVITADTIVWCDHQVLNKPVDYDNAVQILNKLSGNKHQVITGVCLKSKLKTVTFFSLTNVYFKNLTHQEITYYIEKYKPYDKAGAYGIQEWIGYIGIERIDGSYFNVMGLPVQKLYVELAKF